MAAIPFPPEMPVSITEFEYPGNGGESFHPPVAIYAFGSGSRQKVFYDNLNPSTLYEKPVRIVDGVTIHLPDPDLISTNEGPRV